MKFTGSWNPWKLNRFDHCKIEDYDLLFIKWSSNMIKKNWAELLFEACCVKNMVQTCILTVYLKLWYNLFFKIYFI